MAKDTSKISHKLFNTKFLEFWREKFGCEVLICEAEERFRQLLVAEGGTPTSSATIHRWRFRDCNVGKENFDALERLLGCSVVLEEPPSSEKMSALSVDGNIALTVYACFTRFLDGIGFASLEEIEQMYYDLKLDLACLTPFASTALHVVIEQAVRDIALPLTDERTHEPKHVAAIGHYTEQGCFHIDDFAGFAAAQADILRPFHAHLQELAEKLRTFL